MSVDSVINSKAVLTDNESKMATVEEKYDREQELREIEEFEEQNTVVKWALRVLAILLLCCLVFLWVYYR